MKKIAIVLGLTLSLSTLPASYADLPPQVNGKIVTSISGMLSTVLPSVVNITVLGEAAVHPNPKSRSPRSQGNNGNGGDDDNSNDNAPGLPFRRFQEMGSGVIIDATKGYIVTNAHVVADAKNITVTLNDGRLYKAKLIGYDKPSDVAVLQLNTKGLTALPFANSDNLKVGDFVAAIGSPFGLQQTVTSGVISALNRNNLGIEGYENFIQTDASINPGNSGGALVNLKGELIGVNTALLGPVSGNVGIGFAIPSNMVKQVATQLILYGKVQRGILGVMVQNLTPELADAFNISGKQGALVTNVIPGSPAAKAGLQIQDVIEKLNNVDITSGAQVRNMVGLLPFGTKVTMQVHRKDKTMEISTTIMNPKAIKMATAPELNSFLEGVRLTTYDQLVPDFGQVKGVGVLDVDQTSDAWVSGLRPGDVIVEANGKPVPDISALMNAIKDNSDRLLLKVGKDDGMVFLVINRFQ
ncbi:MAG: Do family serine endopeptidase [Gammaproteobacteria bacterium]